MTMSTPINATPDLVVSTFTLYPGAKRLMALCVLHYIHKYFFPFKDPILTLIIYATNVYIVSIAWQQIINNFYKFDVLMSNCAHQVLLLLEENGHYRLYGIRPMNDLCYLAAKFGYPKLVSVLRTRIASLHLSRKHPE